VKLTSKSLRRGAAGIAVASAAILLPAVALASSAGANAPAAAATGRCARADLTSWMGEPGSGAAGSSYFELEISNISRKACTLYGFPGVSALAGGVKPLGSPALRSRGHVTRTVILAPGQTGHVILQIIDVGVYSPSVCRPARADALRIYAPGDYHFMVLPFTFRACQKSGPNFLNVSPVLAGAGIPGYSH
jgi:Protein of unknown function (DUF4232)